MIIIFIFIRINVKIVLDKKKKRLQRYAHLLKFNFRRQEYINSSIIFLLIKIKKSNTFKKIYTERIKYKFKLKLTDTWNDLLPSLYLKKSFT